MLAWDSTKVQGTPTWADFFDTKKIPGKRMLRRTGLAMLEPALLADGVAADKLYPIDQKRALAKIASIKADSLYWNSGAESQQLMRTGECVMGILWHTRANILERDTGGRIKWTFDQAIVQPGIWIVPKNPPAGSAWAHGRSARCRSRRARCCCWSGWATGRPTRSPLRWSSRS